MLYADSPLRPDGRRVCFVNSRHKQLASLLGYSFPPVLQVPQDGAAQKFANVQTQERLECLVTFSPVTFPHRASVGYDP